MDSMALRKRSTTSTGSEAQPASRPWTSSSKTASLISPPQSSGSSMRSMRKRHSFFFGSDTSSAPSLPTLRPSTSRQEDQREHSLTRPQSTLSGQRRHRKTETLDSIRNSLFRSRKKEVSPPTRVERSVSNASLASARNTQIANESRWSREHFRTEDECELMLVDLRARTNSPYRLSTPFETKHIPSIQLPTRDPHS